MALAHAIVGREAELQLLREVLGGRGPPHAVFVEGDAGVGKTALLEAVVEGAAMPVLRARPTAAEAASSYAALHDLLQPLLDGLDALPAPQRRALAAALLLEDAAGPVDPRLVALACLSLLAALPDEPSARVDDWQWLDAATSSVSDVRPAAARAGRGEGDRHRPQRRGGRRLGHARPRAAGRSRAGARRRAAGRPGARRPRPRPHRRAIGAARARAPARGVRGQPADGPRADPRAGAGTATDVRRCSPTGSPRSRPTPARSSAWSPRWRSRPTTQSVTAGLEAALVADILVRDGRRLRFSHPLIAAVVEERTPPAEWRAIHARLAETATGREQRARHLAAAADGPDEEVAAALEAAAGEAEARGATIAAAELLERAAELTPAADAERRIDRLLAAATAAMNAIDGQAARRLVDEVLDENPAGRHRAAALYKLANLVTDDSALRLIEMALDEAGDDDALRAEIHSDAYLFQMMRGEIEIGAAARRAGRRACRGRRQRRHCSRRR